VSSIESSPYYFPPGWVSTGKDFNNNVVGSTGLYWTLAALLGIQIPREQIETITRSVIVQPGLLKRHPDGSGGIQSADDYYGWIAGCSLQGCSHLVREMVAYGEAHAWKFNSLTPGELDWPQLWTRKPWKIFGPWFGRFPGLVCEAYHGSTLPVPSDLLRVGWCASTLLTCVCPGTMQDAYIQTWERVQAYKRQPFFGKWETFCSRIFEWRLKRLGGISMILRTYIGDGNNPLVLMAEQLEG
jgi:hypothetical protein